MANEPLAEQLLTDRICLLQKFQGKGGWTFAEIPEVPPHAQNPFGWRIVKGSIDSYSFKRYHLMPMGTGKLFFPVRAEIRRKIGKHAGDCVRIVLYEDNSLPEIPADLEDCLKMEPGLQEKFSALNESKRSSLIKWIESAKKQETRAERIVEIMNALLNKSSEKQFLKSFSGSKY